MSRNVGISFRIRQVIVVTAAASAAVLAVPLHGAQAGPEATGTISAGVFPGSAVQGSSATFAPRVTASGLSSAQAIKSILITLPAAGWSVDGPARGTSSAPGWSVRSSTASSICWGSKQALAAGSPLQLRVDATTTAALGTATWAVAAYGDSTCTRAVKPLLAQPITNVYVAVAQVGSSCAATANCSTGSVSSNNGNNSVEIIGTGTSDRVSYVSAAVLEELPTGFPELACAATGGAAGGLSRTAHTLVSGGARAHSVRYTMGRDLVNLVADNGAARMDLCMRSEVAFPTAGGGTATFVGKFALGGTGNQVEMYDGLVPGCAVPAVAPCVTSQHKTQNGDMVWEVVLPPGDPYLRWG
jgi:hypothetical protein